MMRSLAFVAAALAGCLASPPDSLPSPDDGADAAIAIDLVVSGGSSPTGTVGGPGGDDYGVPCPDRRFVTGLDGTNNGAGMTSVQAICSRFQLGLASDEITHVDDVDGAPVIGDTDATDLAPIRCSTGLVAVGFHGSENDNELVSHLQLSCAQLVWDGAAVVLSPSELTAELGSPDDFATSDGLCAEGTVAGGIAGRVGLLIDAFRLDCFEVVARAAE